MNQLSFSSLFENYAISKSLFDIALLIMNQLSFSSLFQNYAINKSLFNIASVTLLG